MWFAYDGCGISFGRNVVCEQDACDVGRLTPERFPLRTWVMLSGHLVLPEGWHGVSRDLQHLSFVEDPEREVER